MRQAEWYGRGVRILARATLEALRDPLGNIGQDVARIAASTTAGSTLGIVDLFAGSGNALYSILRHSPSAQGDRLRVRARHLNNDEKESRAAQGADPPVQRRFPHIAQGTAISLG
jgi:hypothetical protein